MCREIPTQPRTSPTKIGKFFLRILLILLLNPGENLVLQVAELQELVANLARGQRQQTEALRSLAEMKRQANTTELHSSASTLPSWNHLGFPGIQIKFFEFFIETQSMLVIPQQFPREPREFTDILQNHAKICKYFLNCYLAHRVDLEEGCKKADNC